jgi:5'-nucleotidase
MKKSEVPKRICVDMDEVIADAVAEHLLRYNRDHGGNITKADLHGKWIWDVVAAEHHDRLDQYLRSEDFFEVLDVMPDSPRVLAALQRRYEVFIATAAMEVPTSFNAKYRWLGRHFPFIPPTHIVFCGDKSILRADYLIDDNPRQLRRFQGEGILYDAPHNAMVTGFRRVKNWLEIEDLFLGGEGAKTNTGIPASPE